MARGHDHSHGMSGGPLRTAIFLTVIIFVVELGGGFLSHSLALFSDAGHVLTDILALGLAWWATVQAERPADARNTYGYHRTGILAALANAVTLILIVLAIGYEAVQRFQHPQAVTPTLMFVSAAVGVVVNLAIGFGLRKEGGDNVNVRAATLHVFSDVAASVGVIIGGVIILLTHWYLADPLISLVIAVLIAWGAWGILRETTDILMEAAPQDLNIAQLVRDIVRQPGVVDVHDLHVWSIAGGMAALSAHIQVDDRPLSACDALLVDLNRLLQDRYKIGHSTLQMECAGCNLNHLYCTMNPYGGSEHGHAHGDHDHVHRHDEQAGGGHHHGQASNGVDARRAKSRGRTGR